MANYPTIRGPIFTDILRMIVVLNDGPEIAGTNYWNLPLAKQGFCLLTGNAGHWRLLLPGCLAEAVQEFLSVERALIGSSVEIAGRVDIVADDGTQAPYYISIDKVMIDREITRVNCQLLVYSETGLIRNLPVIVRP